MDLDPDARRLLDLAREARTPSSRDKERVARLVAGALSGSAAGVAHAGSSGALGKASFTGAVAKWAGIVLVAAGGGVGFFAWRASGPAPPPVAAAVAPVQADPIVPATETAAPADTALEPPVAAPGARRSAAARAPERGAVKAATLPEELDLLHEAQAAWRAGRAGSALELLARHRSTYPRSELTPERDALTVLCLCATGRTAEAQKIARRFLKNAHGSPLRASVEESCARER